MFLYLLEYCFILHYLIRVFIYSAGYHHRAQTNDTAKRNGYTKRFNDTASMRSHHPLRSKYLAGYYIHILP